MRGGSGLGWRRRRSARCKMSTPETFASTPQVEKRVVFPDPPEDPEDKMTSFNRLSITGTAHALAVRLGNPETTLVAGEHYLAVSPTRSLAGVRYPDLLVAFGADPAAYRASNAYVMSEQGKAPDWVMEIVSPGSGRRDRVEKRVDYARLGIGEYWRFDERGRSAGERLAGDVLVSGRYEPIEIETLPGGVLQGYSAALDLHLRWVAGDLVFHDPATGESIATLEGQIARAEAAEARADSAGARANSEREGRVQAEARADTAEARARELEEELRRLRGG